jgi:hypothetical protein
VRLRVADWFYTTYKLKQVYRQMREKNRDKGWIGWLQNMYLAVQGWLVLLAVGICTAVTASFIHTAAKWLGEIKLGSCRQHGFWLDQNLCCLDVESQDDSDRNHRPPPSPLRPRPSSFAFD